jgi:hypothetical protein
MQKMALAIAQLHFVNCIIEIILFPYNFVGDKKVLNSEEQKQVRSPKNNSSERNGYKS